MKSLLTCIMLVSSSISLAFEIKGDLVIVHPSRTWDPLGIAQSEILKTIRMANKQRKTTYLLKHKDQLIFSNYPEDIDSYYIQADEDIVLVESEGGENPIISSTNEITIVGGYLEYCLSNAISHIMQNKGERIKVNIYLPGVFTYGDDRGFITPELNDDFDINSIWPYPLNPGFIHLERQVGRFVECPNKYFIGNFMFSYGGDFPRLGGGPTPENFEYSSSCNDQNLTDHQIGRGGENLLHINFVTEPLELN